MKKPFVWLSGALMAALLALPVQASDRLAEGAGAWTGSGTGRPAANAPAEPIRCRLDNSYDESVGRLILSGRCAFPGQTSRVEGFVEAGSGGSYTAQWRVLRRGTTLNMAGQGDDNRIRFTYATEDGTGAMIWLFSGGGFTITDFNTSGGGSEQVGQIRFTR